MSSATAITDNWNHLAVVRNSGTIELFVNGVSQGTVSNSTNMNSTYGIVIGSGRYQANSTPTAPVKGYIEDFRIVKSAVYTTAFTPPTSPLSSSGATLHIKGTNASIIDKAQKSHLILNGGAVGSTTQVKFAGTKSMYFDGSNDYITLSPDSLQLGSSDFTIESWVYKTTTTAGCLFSKRVSWEAGAITMAQDLSAGTIQIYFYEYNVSTPILSASSVRNSWYHVAVTRSGSTWRLFIDGTQVDTETSSVTILNNNGDLKIGRDDYGSGRWYLGGYLQDFRMTKGLARYTTNFTPPTAELQG